MVTKQINRFIFVIFVFFFAVLFAEETEKKVMYFYEMPGNEVEVLKQKLKSFKVGLTTVEEVKKLINISIFEEGYTYSPKGHNMKVTGIYLKYYSKKVSANLVNRHDEYYWLGFNLDSKLATIKYIAGNAEVLIMQ